MWNSRHDGKDTSSLAQYLMSRFNTKSDTLSPYKGSKFGIGISSGWLYSINNVTQSGKHSLGNTWDTLQTVDQHLSTHNSECLNEAMVYLVLHNALSLLHSEEVLNNMSDSHAPVTRILLFHDECITMQSQQEGVIPNEHGDSRLNNVLQSFGLTTCEIPKNGDCLFATIILHFNHIFQANSDTCLIEHLHSTGVNPSNLDVNLIRI